MYRLKFIHTSDIHLGANPFNIEERFEDIGNALKQVFEFAIKEKVRFVIIAGDFFNNKQLNPKTLEQAIDLLEILKKAKIDVFLTEGNHDMENYVNVYSWLQFLSSKGYIKLLKPDKNQKEETLTFWDGKQGSIYELEDCYIIGLGYPGSTAKKKIDRYVEEIRRLKTEKILEDKKIIVMLHTGINRFLTERMAGLKEEEAESLIGEIDYLALGHIHNRYEKPEKKYFNPGSIECIRITENPFDKGFYLVTLNTNKIDYEFKNIKNRNSIIKTIDITDIEEEKINETIVNEIKNEYAKLESNEKVMLQLKILGFAKYGTKQINIKQLKEKIKKEIPILHEEIINLIEYKTEGEMTILETISREEIDEIVIRENIKNAGFTEDNMQRAYEIIEKMKEYSENESLSLKSNNGEEILRLLLEM